MTAPPPLRARLDVWLWRARFFKTRGAAAAHVEAQGVRLVRAGASRLVSKPGEAVGPGDGLVLRAQGGLRTIRIAALGARRGPAQEARTLYAEWDAPLDDAAPGGHVSLISKE